MRRRNLGRIVQGSLAVVGVAMFAVLVRKVDFGGLQETAGSLVALSLVILLLAAVNYVIDTMGWWLVCGERPPKLRTLMSIRARGEAITNLLPGGALIGEPMKVALLVQATGMTRAEAATSFLLSKFVTVLGHVLYVVTGIALSYAVLSSASPRVFGTANVAAIALGAAVTIFLLLMALLLSMVWFRPMARWLAPTERSGRWRARWNTAVAELHRIEELIVNEARARGGRIVLGLLCCFVAWALNAVEAYIVLRWLDVHIPFTQAYAIDGVSSVVRMLVFVLPIGIGGQDWAITGLMMMYGVPQPEITSANVVVMKRAREFFVVGIGLILLASTARRKEIVTDIAAESSTGEERSAP